MPYDNVPDGDQDKMHSCVQQVMDKGESEEAAIAICYTSVVGGKSIDDAITLYHAASQPAETAQAAQQRGELVALAQLADGQTVKIQVLRSGAFVDMHGLDVLIQDTDLDAYVANSNAALQDAQIPVEIGHPYDPGAPAAAWYTNFYTEIVNGVKWACAEIELTTLGTQALADKLYKYFSGNLDLVAKQIIGGGFVNRPAVSGQQPIGSLSAYLTPRATELAAETTTEGGDTFMTPEEMEAKLAAVRDEERAKLVAQQAEWEAQLSAARADERARVLAEQRRANEIRELANTLTAGPRALWHKPADLEALLGKLTDEDRAIVGALLQEIQQKGLVDLGEHGTQANGATLVQLPPFAQRALGAWLEKSGTVAEWFALNPELGTADQYDLKGFEK